MRASAVRRLQLSHAFRANPLASTNGLNGPLKPAPLALLPPIPLYRRLFRAHRHRLGVEERLLGDQYIKAEFRAHRNVENPMHIIGFLTEWQLYAQKLEGSNWKDEKMDQSKVEKLSDEQIYQMYELMREIRGLNEDPDKNGT